MDTAHNRYDEPWNRQHGPPRPMINPPRLHTYHTPKQHMADSAECWPNTISKYSPYHKKKIYIYIFTYLPPVKDALGLRTPGIYSIPCECGRFYIGQSGRSIQIRIKEHNRHIGLAHIVFDSRSFNYFGYIKLPSEMPAIPICLSLLFSI
jgi:hypothetical protein